MPAYADPEDALRRYVIEGLGFDPGPLAPQPPLDLHVEAVPVHVLLFAARVAHDEALPIRYAELHWLAPARMAEFALDPIAAEVLAGFQRDR